MDKPADYDSIPCPNFRDVSEALAGLIASSGGKLQTDLALPRDKILRGGSIDYTAPADIRNPRTVINLKMGPDNMSSPIFTEHKAKYIQHAVDNSIDKYHTHLKEVRTWLNDLLFMLQTFSPDRFPVFIHCRAGKDRTGVAVAALLIALGFPKDLVAQEFLLSPQVKAEDIENILKPIVTGPPHKYFSRVNLAKLRENLGVLVVPTK